MTGRALYLKALRELKGAGIDSPSQDALLLSQKFLGLDRRGLALHGEEDTPQDREGAFLAALAQRCSRRPLQYILGSWEFMDLRLNVGEGVLVPREDTAVLVETLAQGLSGVQAPTGLDLCAGTGAVGLGLCSLLPDVSVLCVELSPQAFPYLERNLASYPQYHAKAVCADVLAGPGERFPQGLDFIAANPPYIPSGELPGLQPEVRREPALALDGGEDGLVFYRAIAKLWAPLLKPGGLLAVEIGEEQGQAVSRIFAENRLSDVTLKQDWAGLDRCMIGRQGR